MYLQSSLWKGWTSFFFRTFSYIRLSYQFYLYYCSAPQVSAERLSGMLSSR